MLLNQELWERLAHLAVPVVETVDLVLLLKVYDCGATRHHLTLGFFSIGFLLSTAEAVTLLAATSISPTVFGVWFCCASVGLCFGSSMHSRLHPRPMWCGLATCVRNCIGILHRALVTALPSTTSVRLGHICVLFGCKMAPA